MYHDVERNASTIKQHPIIRTLSGDITAISTDKIDIDGFDHDAVEPRAAFSVVDADSSQQDAIFLAKRGISFVLQGPPGTGKSQTITNIIAELLADGKRVLFVSEKMAALEVVYKRLSRTGLSDFCFALHSHNAKRREVLEQIERSLKLAKNNAKLSEEAFNHLFQLKHHRKLLNDYSQELHTVIQPLGKTIYYANGRIAALGDCPIVSYTQKDADTFTSSYLAKCFSLLEDVSRIIAESGYQRNNPWLGCTITNLTNQFRQQFSVDAKKILELFDDGFRIIDAVNTDWDSKTDWSHTDIPHIISALAAASSSPGAPFEWTLLDVVAVQHQLSGLQKSHRLRDALYRDVESAHRHKEVLENERDNARIRFAEQNERLQAAESVWLAEREKHLVDYDEAIFEIDASTVLTRFRTDYSSIFGKILKVKAYKADRNIILTCRKATSRLSFDDTKTLLQNLTVVQDLRAEWEKEKAAQASSEERYNRCKEEFADIQVKIDELQSTLANQIATVDKDRQLLSSMLDVGFDDNTDYDNIEKQLLWASQFSEFVKSMNLSEAYVKSICACNPEITMRSAQQRAKLSTWSEQVQITLGTFTVLSLSSDKICI